MNAKNVHNLKRLTVSSLLAALTCLGNLVVLKYTPAGGYIHLGDCFVLLSGFLMGPLWGGLAAGLGAALTDLILGYAVYVPATFLIKWGVAALASVLMRLLMSKSSRAAMAKYALSGAVGECVMVGGYFVYELMLYGFAGAVPNILMNAVQAASGVIAATLLIIPITKIKYLRNFWI